MPNFTDNGDPALLWDMRVTAGTILRVKSQCDLLLPDLCESVEDEASGEKVIRWMKVKDDLEQFVNILWAIVEPQAIERNIDTMQFAERLGGDALYRAFIGMAEGLRDFFLASPDQKHLGEMIGTLVEKQDEMHKLNAEMAKPAIQKMKDVNVRELGNKVWRDAYVAQESSESSPGVSPGTN